MSNPLIGQGWQFPPDLNPRGNVALVSDHQEIEQSILIILSTAPGQRVMRPEFGCRIHELVFAPNNATTAGLAARYVRQALGRWEPRIRLVTVEVAPAAEDPSRLEIKLEYVVNATHSRRSLVYPFYLLPEEATR